MMEWLCVDGTEDHYSVSNEGLVRSEDRYVPHRNSFAFRKGKILKPYRTGNKRNYLKVDIHGKSEAVHRLVALAFIPNPENKPEVNHIDGNTFNNHHSNLEWVTCSENVQHAVALGLLVRGSGDKCYNTKRRVAVLKDGKHITILTGSKEIEEFGLSATKVSACLKGIRLSHRGFTFKEVALEA